MAYYGRHSGKSLDDQIDRVISGDVVSDNTSQELLENDKKPVAGGILKIIIEELQRLLGINTSDIESIRDQITSDKEWQEGENERLEGLAVFAATKVYKEALANINAEYESFVILVGNKQPQPVEWLDYLRTYTEYKTKLESVVRLLNPDSINVSGFERARANYIEARNALQEVLGFEDIPDIKKRHYEWKIQEVNAQREEIIQEFVRLEDITQGIADSNGATIYDSDGVMLGSYINNGTYNVYDKAASEYISIMRDMIDNNNYDEGDAYKSVSENYYLQYKKVKAQLATGRMNRFDSIDVTTGNLTTKVGEMERRESYDSMRKRLVTGWSNKVMLQKLKESVEDEIGRVRELNKKYNNPNTGVTLDSTLNTRFNLVDYAYNITTVGDAIPFKTALTNAIDIAGNAASQLSEEYLTSRDRFIAEREWLFEHIEEQGYEI